jgi:hypothetical protein
MLGFALSYAENMIILIISSRCIYAIEMSQRVPPREQWMESDCFPALRFETTETLFET